MLSVKQGSIKYHFLRRLWYDASWDWAPVSRTISEHSTHKANEPVKIENEDFYCQSFWLFVCLVFMAYQSLLVIQRQSHVYTNSQF